MDARTGILVTLIAPFIAWWLSLATIFVNRRNPNGSGRRLVSTLALSGTGVAFLASLTLLGAARGGEVAGWVIPWLTTGDVSLTLNLGLDQVTAVMLAVVSGISLMVQVYSLEYMRDDDHYPRYFANVILFTFAMLLLLVARDFLVLLAGWELMGVCSHLLIGHFYTTEAAKKASVKAFLTTRLGDVGLFLALLTMWSATGSLRFQEVFAAAPMLDRDVATVIALGLFLAAAGKSAQFPLHVWLPDAMAGPTPASALIHAATMVAAGVYLMARSAPILAAAPLASQVVAVIGALTALIAGTMALRTFDLKRVLAYSTVSQLGYMMLALGSGGTEAALFHLMTHAFFKALLFLGAGAVIHAVHTQDMREMGGLARRLPLVATVFAIGSLALVGIPPFAGYFSKEEILAAVAGGNMPILTYVALLTVGLTGLYTFRAYYLTFLAPEASQAGRGNDGHSVHRPSWLMEVPLALLAIPAAGAGLLGSRWAAASEAGEHAAESAPWIAPVALILAVGGLGLGWFLYEVRLGRWLRRNRLAGLLFEPAAHGYYLDSLWENLVLETGRRIARVVAVIDRWLTRAIEGAAEVAARGLAKVIVFFDRHVLDALADRVAEDVHRLSGRVERTDRAYLDSGVDGFARVVSDSGGGVKRLETGRVTTYLFAFLCGLVFYLVVARMLA